MPMNQRTGDEVVELAGEPRFALAHATVIPSALTVEANGWSQRLEPRAMQVLVVLAGAGGAVVGRGELNARVWGGRLVGEDAVNRAVQVLRRLATAAPRPPPFRIDTVPRVGYRLVAGGSAAACDDEEKLARPSAPARQARRPRRLLFGGAILVVAVAGLGWRFAADRTPAQDWQVAASDALDDLPAGAANAVLSPDGRRLAYRVRDGAGRERVFVRAAADGGTGSPVSPAGVDARRPAWSPDGRRLAFAGYDPDRPCRLFVTRPGGDPQQVGTCETVREPRLAWTADQRSLLFGDAPGENAVQRIVALRVADGRRTVLSSPPGDSMGDGLPVALGGGIAFQRQFGWADEGWIVLNPANGGERLVWRRRGVAGTVAATLGKRALAVAWTRAGTSGIDAVALDGASRSRLVVSGPVTAISAAAIGGGARLLVEADLGESALVRAGEDGRRTVLATVRGRISGPVLLTGGRIRFPVTAVGVGRIWERSASGRLRAWPPMAAARTAGLATPDDGWLTAALVTATRGREVVLFDRGGRRVFRWNPHARSANPAAWSSDGRHLVVPVLDGAGWRLFAVDPLGRTEPRDMGLPGFAVVQGVGSALYAVRAGETTGLRELWRLDGAPRRLPVDLTLFDIVNWRAVPAGVWLPDRSDRANPRLLLRDANSGRVLRQVAAPGLAGPGSGLAADAEGPIYVQGLREAPDYALLTLTGR